jgi:hypothetical protein
LLTNVRKRYVEFQRDPRYVRRVREAKTIRAMVRMYCRGHRHAPDGALCTACSALCDYAARRLERCVFGDAKPTCSNCVVHCYSAAMREQVRTVMRWAGPRMLLRHPLLGIAHLIDENRPIPTLPAKRSPQDPQRLSGDNAVETTGN